MPALDLDMQSILPDNGLDGLFVGRVWRPGQPTGQPAGPSPVLVRADGVYDLSHQASTLATLLAAPDLFARLQNPGERIGDLAAILANSAYHQRHPERAYFLAPADLQALKACGVTFVSSMLERVIEEQAKGNPAAAAEIRRAIAEEIGDNLRDVAPGSPEAERVKSVLVERGLWSQYLEVGIGPDAEVFTKSQPLAAVGVGAEIGIHPGSAWSNPEPEVVLVITPQGNIVGVTLGNDVNLRDFEGRSALLLGKAKDNRGSCAIGPFIRLFDDDFTLERAGQLTIQLTVEGDDGFTLQGNSPVAEISRSLTDLAGQALGANNHYPDGMLLFTGTMFAPTQDRDGADQGFTHHLGDIVTIRNADLGALINRVNHSDQLPRWTFGLSQLMHNLSQRGLL